ncbi:MAG: nitroreductase family protein [Caulobacter sp.]|nr:nitroreductase family protein [Caulobacter sp.]
MSHNLPAPPVFGDTLPVTAAPEVLTFLSRRRSASALTLGAPAPSPEELADLLTLAARVPDHGKLAPWRFIILRGDAKADLAARLDAIAAARPDSAKLLAKLGKLKAPPLGVVVVSRTTPGDIPAWEQQLSAGAVCTTLLYAAAAMGYGANWITDWYAYDPETRIVLGLSPDEQVAGFIFLGTPAEAPQERVRPDVTALTTIWGD